MTYAYLCIGRNPDQVKELDLMLEYEDYEQRLVDLRNRQATEALMARGGSGFIPPPPKR